jgi:hypothetical protein
MNSTQTELKQWPDLESPKRNRFYYGKLMDTHHFRLETDYLNQKRWLVNRLVGGYGVICGLNVVPGKNPKEIVICAGVAIDKWGQEMIVPEPKTVVIPDSLWTPKAEVKQTECDDDNYIHVLLCYLECESDPAPVLVGDCSQGLCTNGAIRERYYVKFQRGRLEAVSLECTLQAIVSGRHIDYCALAKHVSQNCSEPPNDPCIPLANIRLPKEENQCQCSHDDIDICIRPIVFTNDLLFNLVICLLSDAPRQRGLK